MNRTALAIMLGEGKPDSDGHYAAFCGQWAPEIFPGHIYCAGGPIEETIHLLLPRVSAVYEGCNRIYYPIAALLLYSVVQLYMSPHRTSTFSL